MLSNCKKMCVLEFKDKALCSVIIVTAEILGKQHHVVHTMNAKFFYMCLWVISRSFKLQE